MNLVKEQADPKNVFVKGLAVRPRAGYFFLLGIVNHFSPLSTKIIYLQRPEGCCEENLILNFCAQFLAQGFPSPARAP